MTTESDLRVMVDDNYVSTLEALIVDIKTNPNSWIVETNDIFDEEGVGLFATDRSKTNGAILVYRNATKLGIMLTIHRRRYWFQKETYMHKVQILSQAPSLTNALTVEHYGTYKFQTVLVEALRDLFINFKLMKKLKQTLEWKDTLKQLNIAQPKTGEDDGNAND